MSTKFEDVYGLFMSQIDDYELSTSDNEDIEQVLTGFLENSFIHIYSVFTDVEIDKKSKEFSRTLTMFEKLLIAKSMKLEWLGEKLNSQELMCKSIGDRDYNAVQGTGYLKELRELYSKQEKEVKRFRIDYTYNNDAMIKELLGGG